MADNASTSVLAFHDIRWNSWRWKPILERWGYLRMFVDPELLKTTTILISKGERVGTVFFVRAPLYDQVSHGLFGEDYYAVTAGHCIKGEVLIRCLFKNGTHHDEPTMEEDWIRDDQSDVAVLPLSFPIDQYNIKPIPLRDIIQSSECMITRKPSHEGALVQALDRLYFDVGDEVFTIGLFENDEGPALTRPIMRFGHLALTPSLDEKVWIKNRHDDYVQVQAMLVEMAVWQGQSGSPVFLRPWAEDKRHSKTPVWEFNFLLGLAHGFYPGEQEVEINHNKTLISGLGTGISVVIPGSKIVEMLMTNKLQERREKMLRDKSRPDPKHIAVPASKEPSFTGNNFEDALRRASRKVPESALEKKRKP